MKRDLLKEPVTYWEMIDWLLRHVRPRLSDTDLDPEIIAQIRRCIDAFHASFYRPGEERHLDRVDRGAADVEPNAR